MSDMQRPMQAQGAEMRPKGDEVMEKNRSMFNPTDVAAMKEGGELNPDMSIRDFFAQRGVDVDGPIIQMQKFMQDEVKKANPMNKAKQMARSAPPDNPMKAKMAGMQGGGRPPQGPPPEEDDPLAALMARHGRGGV